MPTYKVMVGNTPIVVETMDDAIRLARKVDAEAKAANGSKPAVRLTIRKGKDWGAITAKALELLLTAGPEGLEAGALSSQLGLKGPRALGPLRRHVTELLKQRGGRNDASLTKTRVDGKRRWYLTSGALDLLKDKSA